MSPQPVTRAQAGSGPTEELQEVQITARRLDNNPQVVDPSFSMTPDEQRNAQAVEEVQVTAQRRSDPFAGIEEVVVSAPRMTAQEIRAYDAREALRMTLGGILAQHRREQEARNMVEADMTAGHRALVSLGGIMHGGYQSVKAGVVGLKDLTVAQLEFNQRVMGDLLHGDLRAANAEFADLFGMGAEKAKALLAGAKNIGVVLGDAESRQMLMDFAQEYYGTSSQITQSELLGKLPMELLIAAGTAGAGGVIAASGVPQRIGGAINSLADALNAVDVRFPIVLDRTAINSGGLGSIKGFQSPFVSTTAQLRGLSGIAKSAEWITPEQGVPGPGLRAHFAKHGSQVNVSTAREYDLSARLTMQNGRSFTYRDRSSNAPRIGYFDGATGLFTATSNIGKVTHIHTHFPQTWEELRRLPGFSVVAD